MRITAGILTVSDRAYKGIYEDLSGPALVQEVQRLDWPVIQCSVVPDDKKIIQSALKEWCDEKKFTVVLTTGGTGLGPRDVTPEATKEILDKEIPALAILMQIEGLKHTPLAVLSRSVAGVRMRTLIINLPGSPEGACQSFRAVSHLLEHAFSMLRGEGHSKEFKHDLC